MVSWKDRLDKPEMIKLPSMKSVFTVAHSADRPNWKVGGLIPAASAVWKVTVSFLHSSQWRYV